MERVGILMKANWSVAAYSGSPIQELNGSVWLVHFKAEKVYSVQEEIIKGTSFQGSQTQGKYHQDGKCYTSFSKKWMLIASKPSDPSEFIVFTRHQDGMFPRTFDMKHLTISYLSPNSLTT